MRTDHDSLCLCCDHIGGLTPLGRETGPGLKKIYVLFPGGPAKGARKIAGLPKTDRVHVVTRKSQHWSDSSLGCFSKGVWRGMFITNKPSPLRVRYR
jgi:hypothetical protein